jgi:hypothetical protein
MGKEEENHSKITVWQIHIIVTARANFRKYCIFCFVKYTPTIGK